MGFLVSPTTFPNGFLFLVAESAKRRTASGSPPGISAFLVRLVDLLDFPLDLVLLASLTFFALSGSAAFFLGLEPDAHLSVDVGMLSSVSHWALLDGDLE